MTEQIRSISGLKYPMNLQHFADNPENPENPENPNPENPENPENPNPENPENPGEPEKTFSQAELNEQIKKRLTREREKYAGFDDIKKELEAFKQADEEKKRAEMTESERLTKDKEALEQKLANLEQAMKKDKLSAAFTKAAAAHKVEYMAAAEKLADMDGVQFDESGNPVGVDELVKALVEANPFLAGEKKKAKEIGGPSNPDTSKSEKTNDERLAEAGQKARSGRIEDLVAYANLKKELGK